MEPFLLNELHQLALKQYRDYVRDLPKVKGKQASVDYAKLTPEQQEEYKRLKRDLYISYYATMGKTVSQDILDNIEKY